MVLAYQLKASDRMDKKNKQTKIQYTWSTRNTLYMKTQKKVTIKDVETYHASAHQKKAGVL